MRALVNTAIMQNTKFVESTRSKWKYLDIVLVNEPCVYWQDLASVEDLEGIEHVEKIVRYCLQYF